ncbi:hypothetical protein FGO68_gene6346 [Halteria grandinella]|uniref:Uncharacterized protein n=1 Tax=Halteria grandinella TaxID=5974 RepID=A0A8J8P4R6_HALGN|nr:hypothetical protein FGO68_gene6346 [Halteria grandinella]
MRDSVSQSHIINKREEQPVFVLRASTLGFYNLMSSIALAISLQLQYQFINLQYCNNSLQLQPLFKHHPSLPLFLDLSLHLPLNHVLIAPPEAALTVDPLLLLLIHDNTSLLLALNYLSFQYRHCPQAYPLALPSTLCAPL